MQKMHMKMSASSSTNMIIDSEKHTRDLTNKESSLLILDKGEPKLARIDQVVPIFSAISDLMAYEGLRSVAMLMNGSVFDRVKSSKSVNNVTVISVNGDTTSRWILRQAFRENIERWGVKVSDTPSALMIASNTNGLLSAVQSGERLSLPIGAVSIDGIIESVDLPLSIVGSGMNSIIRQKSATRTIYANNKGVGLNEFLLADFTLEADSGSGPFLSGSAICYEGYPYQGTADSNTIQDRVYGQPMATISGIRIKGVDNFRVPVYPGSYVLPWRNGFFKGIELKNCNVPNLQNIRIQGAGFRRGVNDLIESIGIEMTATRAMIEPTLQDVTVYNYHTGLKVHATVHPGIEGLRLNPFTAAGVYIGVDVENLTYGSPGFWLTGGSHISADKYCVHIKGTQQGFITDCLLYNNGNSDGSVSNPGDAIFINLEGANDWTIHNNRMYFQNIAGATNPVYGITVKGIGNGLVVGNYIHNNLIVLKPGAETVGVWLQNGAVNNHAHDNRREGGAFTVVNSLSPNLIHDNFPLDADDKVTRIVLQDETEVVVEPQINEATGLPDRDSEGNIIPINVTRPRRLRGAYLSKINYADASQGYKLEIDYPRSQYLIMPSIASIQPAGLLAPGYKIKQVVIRDAKEYTIQCDEFVEFVHDLNYIRLQNNMNVVVQPAQTISFKDNSQRAEQTGGRLSGARYITDSDSPDLAPGVYTLHKEIYPDTTGYHSYNLIRQRYQAPPNVSNTPFYWEIASHIKTGLVLTRAYRGQDTVGWTPWEPLSNRTVKSSAVPTTANVVDGNYAVHLDTDTNMLNVWVNDNGTMRNLMQYFAVGAAPSGFPDGAWAVHRNPTGGRTSVYVNVGGTIVDIQATTPLITTPEYTAATHGPLLFDEASMTFKRSDYNQMLYSISKNIPTYNLAGDALPLVFNPNTQVISKGGYNQFYSGIMENPTLFADLVFKLIHDASFVGQLEDYFDTKYAAL